MAWNGFRFQNVAVPAGAKISSAYLEFVSETDKSEPTSLTIFGQSVDDAAAFSGANDNISGRSRTSASVAWNAISSWQTGQSYQTPDIQDVIQEIVDRSGWVSGNDLAILVRSEDSNGNRIAWSRDDSESRSVLIHIEFDNLVLHLKLDEASGTTATDSSSIANNGSFENGATSGTDGPAVSDGIAASFDGVDDKISVPNDTAYDLADKITVSAWVNFDQALADQTSQQSLVSRFTWSDKKGFQLFTDQPSSNSLRFRVLNGSWKDAVWMNPDIGAGGWRHVVGTYDGATIRLYVDGELKASNNETNALAAHPGADLSIGSKLDGRLADVRIYNRALSATEIAEMNGQFSHWKFDEISGTTAADSSGGGNNGVLVNTTAWTTDGRSNGALSLTDDASDHVALPSSLLDGADDVTFAAWFRTTKSTDYQVLIGGANASITNEYQLWLWDSDRVSLSDGESTSTFVTWFLSDSYADGNWHHLAVVRDAANDQSTLYYDGVSQGTQTQTLNALSIDSGGLILGEQQDSVGGGFSTHEGFVGTLDEVYLFRRVLTPVEIAEIAKLNDLIGHWKLTETSGTTAVDSGPGGADGTYENGVALDQGGPYPGVTAPVFDGSNDHVELPKINANFQNGLTVAAWIQPDATLSSGQFYEILDLSNGSEVDQILLSYNGAAGLQLFLTDTADGSSIRTIEDNTGFTPGQWVHCVATVDADGNAKIYRNGQVTKSGFFTSLPMSVTRATATIGKSSFGEHFGGGLQDVRLYNYELTPAEINEVYGLVGDWNFDDGSGTTATESSDNASDADFNTGTPAWVEGVRGTALEFDGTNDARTTEAFDPPERGAVSMWFRSDGPPASRQRIWGLGADYEMWQDADGAVSMDIATDGYQGGFITIDPLYTEGRWYHLVAQYDSADESYEIYVDGVLHKSGTSTWDIKKQAENFLSFGTRTGSTQRFTGAIDDFQIYNRWLSIGEIAETYGLVGWWRMEETSGSTVSDSSGAGNHGAFVGSSGWSTNAKEGSGSIDLDGTNHVEIPSLILAKGSGTLAGWARLTNNDSYGSELISLGNHFGIRIDSTRSGKGSYGYTYNGSSWNDVKPNIYHEGAGWHHFALVANDEDLTRKFYIDGVLQETFTASGPLVMSGQDSTTLIGSKGSNYDFTGQIDDVRVYNRIVTPQEVRTLYYGEEVLGLRIVKWLEVANP